MKKIRILRIIGQCKSGGTEAIALNYYKNLDHTKIAMDFLFYGESLPRFQEVLSKYGDKVINITDYTDNLIKSIFDIKGVVSKGKYDIVHSQLNALNFFPLLGALLGGCKIRLASNHSTASLKYETKKSIIKYLIRPTVKWTANRYAACSKHAGEWCFGKKAIKDNKVHIIKNAIDLDVFKYDEAIRNKVRSQNDWDDKYVIGHAGRFTEQKNHFFIIDIFKRVSEKCPNAILVLIGDGHLVQDVKQYSERLGLKEKVFFLGTRFDVNDLMQGMDLFLFPSLYEGLGNVITESQAVCLRSVCSNEVPYEVKMTDLVDFLSLKDSVDLWADKVLEYSTGYERYDVHGDIQEAGYEIKSAAKDLEKYYFSLLKQEKSNLMLRKSI